MQSTEFVLQKVMLGNIIPLELDSISFDTLVVVLLLKYETIVCLDKKHHNTRPTTIIVPQKRERNVPEEGSKARCSPCNEEP